MDLSVESTIGLVAFVVGRHPPPEGPARSRGVGRRDRPGPRARDGERRRSSRSSRCPRSWPRSARSASSAAWTSSWRNGHEVNLDDLPRRLHERGQPDASSASRSSSSSRSASWSRVALVPCGSRASAGSSTPSAATPRPPRSSASARARSVFVAFAMCGLLAGVAGVLWGINFGTIYASSASGHRAADHRRGRGRRGAISGRLRDRRRRGPRRAVPGPHQQRPAAAGRAAGAAPGDLRRRDPRRGQHRRPDPARGRGVPSAEGALR